MLGFQISKCVWLPMDFVAYVYRFLVDLVAFARRAQTNMDLIAGQ